MRTGGRLPPTSVQFLPALAVTNKPNSVPASSRSRLRACSASEWITIPSGRSPASGVHVAPESVVLNR